MGLSGRGEKGRSVSLRRQCIVRGKREVCGVSSTLFGVSGGMVFMERREEREGGEGEVLKYCSTIGSLLSIVLMKALGCWLIKSILLELKDRNREVGERDDRDSNLYRVTSAGVLHGAESGP